MPRSDGRGGPLCTDCYFSREMLCALKRYEGCKTYRPVVGRDEKAISPTMQQLEMNMYNVQPIKPAAVVEEPKRAAAAQRTTATTCVVDVSADGPEVVPQAPVTSISQLAVHRRGREVGVRVRSRVAERYPQALQLC